MKKTYIYALISIFFWSTVSAITKLLLSSYDNFQVLWISAFFAASFLIVLNVVTGKIKLLKNYKPKDYARSLLAGLPGTFFYYLFFYAGTDLMPASQAFIVNYTWPIMSIVFACIILKEKMTLRKGIAVGLSFLGVVIVMGDSFSQLNGKVLTGALCCILGAISYGIFTSLSQKFAYEKCNSMMLNYVVTFVLTSIINAFRGNLFVPTWIEAAGFAWNGMFTMGIATTLWALALESGQTAKISNLAYITPFVSLVWVSLLLKEELHYSFLIGLAVIIIGVFIQLKDKTGQTGALLKK